MKPARIQRCELAAPASSPQYFEKAALAPADRLFLDLEDAVATSRRLEARANAVAALSDIDWKRSSLGSVTIRSNLKISTLCLAHPIRTTRWAALRAINAILYWLGSPTPAAPMASARLTDRMRTTAILTGIASARCAHVRLALKANGRSIRAKLPPEPT